MPENDCLLIIIGYRSAGTDSFQILYRYGDTAVVLTSSSAAPSARHHGPPWLALLTAQAPL